MILRHPIVLLAEVTGPVHGIAPPLLSLAWKKEPRDVGQSTVSQVDVLQAYTRLVCTNLYKYIMTQNGSICASMGASPQ